MTTPPDCETHEEGELVNRREFVTRSLQGSLGLGASIHRWMEVVVPVSLLGLPSLAVPSGFGAGGLPTGVQLIGAPGTDRFVLEVGEAYHHATHWPQRMPPPDCV